MMIEMCLLHAKRSTAVFWKESSRPSVAYWVRQMLITFPLERETYIRKVRQDMFEKVRRPFNVFVKCIDLADDEEEEE